MSPATNEYQDFADQNYKWFGDRKNFSRLTQLAKQYGIQNCYWAMGELKEKGIHNIGYFSKLLQAKYKS